MKMRKFKITVVVAISFIIFGCGTSRMHGMRSTENSRTILVAVDRSKSMHLNDPEKLGPESLQAMIALAPPGASFGIVAYSEQVEELAPLEMLYSKKDRERVSNAVSKMKLRGKTDFDIAFKKGNEIFTSGSAPEGSMLVLLTDGQHNRGNVRVIMDTVRIFENNKWKINALAVTPSRRLEFLDKITMEGGGEAFKITKARESLDASLKLAANAENMFAFLGDYSAVTVLPGTENLLLVALKATPDAGFVSFLPHEGSSSGLMITREDPTVYAYPATLDDSGHFDIVNVTTPAYGLYKIVTKGTAAQSHVLSNLPVTLSFSKGSLKDLYDKNEAVGISIEVETDNKELYELIKASGALELKAEPNGPGNRLTEVLELTEVNSNGDSKLVFTGEVHLFGGGAEPVEFVLTGTFAVNCAFDGVWLRKISTSVKVKPGGSILAVTPAEIDFGHHWSDEEALTKEFEVSAVYTGMVAVKLGDLPDGYSTSPVSFDVNNELNQKVIITLDPSKVVEFGGGDFDLVMENTVIENNNRGQDFLLNIKSGVYNIEIPEEFLITAHPGKEVSELVPFKVTPPVKFKYEAGVLSNETGELAPKVIENEDGSIALAVTIPLDIPDGVYKGELKMTPEIEGLSERVIKISLSVSGMPQLIIEPQELKLVADKSGWVEETIALRAEHYEDIEFDVILKDLESKTAGMRISGEYDTKFEPIDGWEGKIFKSGDKYNAKIGFYISSDLKSGSYSGEVEFSLKYRGNNKVKFKLPVDIELTR